MYAKLGPPSKVMKFVCYLVFAGAFFGFAHALYDFILKAYVYSASFRTSGPTAYLGIFGLMTVLAGPFALITFGLFGLRKVQLAIICGIVALLLMLAAQIGRVPCRGQDQIPQGQCDVSGMTIRDNYIDWGSRMSFKKDIGPFQIAGILVFLSGFGLLIRAFGNWKNAKNSIAWPTTQGIVTASKVNRYISKPYLWDWNIEYRYSVGSHQYRSSRAYFGSSPSITMARRVVATYPLQSQVTVYYHPVEQGESVLLPGVNKYSYISFIAAPLAWLFALACWSIPK